MVASVRIYLMMYSLGVMDEAHDMLPLRALLTSKQWRPPSCRRRLMYPIQYNIQQRYSKIQRFMRAKRWKFIVGARLGLVQTIMLGRHKSQHNQYSAVPRACQACAACVLAPIGDWCADLFLPVHTYLSISFVSSCFARGSTFGRGMHYRIGLRDGRYD